MLTPLRLLIVVQSLTTEPVWIILASASNLS